MFDAYMFHYVRDHYTDSGIFGYTVSEFSSLVDAVDESGQIVHPLDILDRKDDLHSLSGYVLTFDDGFQEHYHNVWKKLKSRNRSALFFVPTAPLVHEQVLPLHRAHMLRARLGETAFVKTFIDQVPDLYASYMREINQPGDSHYRWDSVELRQFKYFLIYVLDYDILDDVTRGLFESHMGDEKAASRELYLGHEHIREMTRDGAVFGGHGHKHYLLTHLDADQEKEDIMTSTEILEDLCGKLRFFSYPYGKEDSYTPETVPLLKSCGYEASFTSVQSLYNPNDEDSLFFLPRMDAKDVPCAQ